MTASVLVVQCSQLLDEQGESSVIRCNVITYRNKVHRCAFLLALLRLIAWDRMEIRGRQADVALVR